MRPELTFAVIIFDFEVCAPGIGAHKELRVLLVEDLADHRDVFAVLDQV